MHYLWSFEKKNEDSLAGRVWRKGNPLIPWWECKLVHPLWRMAWRFLKELELAYDPAVPLLGKYPDRTITQKDTCTSVFVSAVFTMARTQKQPKCPSVDEQMKMCVCVCVCVCGKILLGHEKEWNNAICSNLDAPRDYHTKKSKSERQIPYHLYEESKIWHK